jgi:hypothetical protein
MLAPSLGARYPGILGATYVLSAHRGAVRYYPSLEPGNLFSYSPNLSWAGMLISAFPSAYHLIPELTVFVCT